MRSAPVATADSTCAASGSKKIEVRIPCCLNSCITSFKNDRFATVSQPALEVMASGASGTSVTCAGLTSHTSFVALASGALALGALALGALRRA